MTDIFLSYARENNEQARMLANVLAGFGWTVFWDRDILAGSVFDDVIQEQLDHTKCVVCLWSVHSVSSQWVRAEAEEGANRNMLVSVLIDDVRLPIAFRRIQAAKLLNWTGSKDDEQLRDVLKAVKFVVEKPPQVNNTTSGVQAASQTTRSGLSSSTPEASFRTNATAMELAPSQRPWWKQTRNIGLIFSILILGAAAAYWWFKSGSVSPMRVNTETATVTKAPSATNGVSTTAPAPQVDRIPAGPIGKKYSELGASSGLLGAPVGKEKTTPDGIGRLRHYENGVIYWSPTTGAHEVHGDILRKWQDYQFEQGLGYPTTDETVTPDGVGRFNHFRKDQNESSIYWTPTTGAHAVYGEIRKKWAELGWERSFLGYPVTDEGGDQSGGRRSSFQHGVLRWSSGGGLEVLRGRNQ